MLCKNRTGLSLPNKNVLNVVLGKCISDNYSVKLPTTGLRVKEILVVEHFTLYKEGFYFIFLMHGL